jgi:hypothetical protein
LKTRRRFCFLLALTSIFVFATSSIGGSSFEFIFFGVNLESLRDSNWGEVAIGAVASLLVHELGHVLYLQARGKDWDLVTSNSGLGIHTSEFLSQEEYRNFGRSGFLLQTGIGFLLTSFERTRQSDFTKGWVCMNVFQASTYSVRDHDAGDDIAMIDRGNGNGSSEMMLFSAMSLYNTWNAFLPVYSPFSAGSQSASAGWLPDRREGDRIPDLELNEVISYLPSSSVLLGAASSFAVKTEMPGPPRLAQFSEYRPQDSYWVQESRAPHLTSTSPNADDRLNEGLLAGKR